MPTKVSNPRDLVLQLAGRLLFVERRLADAVLPDLVAAVADEELRDVLVRHHHETRAHVGRVETLFRRLEAAPSSNLSRPFESAVAEHDELAPSMLEPRLADVFHAQAALHVEHFEIAAYTTLLGLAADAVRELLQPSLDEEVRAADLLKRRIERLHADAG